LLHNFILFVFIFLRLFDYTTFKIKQKPAFVEKPDFVF